MRRSALWMPWLAAAASLLLATGPGFAWQGERRQRLALQQDAWDSRAGLERREALLARVLGPEVRTTTLAATGADQSMRL